MAHGAVARKVVLPPGKWLADDGKTYIGPACITVDAPLGRIPHFVRNRRLHIQTLRALHYTNGEVDMSFPCGCAPFGIMSA